MNRRKIITVLLAAYLVVFLESSVRGPRLLLGAQIDLLPALMVYASLKLGLAAFSLLAVFGGLGFDALSANPLGVSVLPLFVVGSLLYCNCERILGDEPFAQCVIGLIAGAVTPLLNLALLFSVGASPSVGWPFLWQWFVLTLGGGAFTPGCFWLFAWIDRTFSHPLVGETSFRPDRELDRGRF
jgi:rod shape-determining protein MreD